MSMSNTAENKVLKALLPICLKRLNISKQVRAEAVIIINNM